MRDVTPAAKKRLNDLERAAAEQFDAHILHNAVADAVRDDDRLRQLVDVTERAYAIEENSDHQDGVHAAGFDAAEELNSTIDGAVDDVVADVCATVVDEADEWTDHHDEADCHEAAAEAKAWLGDHLEAVERNKIELAALAGDTDE